MSTIREEALESVHEMGGVVTLRHLMAWTGWDKRRANNVLLYLHKTNIIEVLASYGTAHVYCLTHTERREP